jgi:NAD(P)-dependent dehydrogenase (short-subunit alcohol dehydrogenase family)
MPRRSTAAKQFLPEDAAVMRRAALVTGASSGIGAAACRRLRGEGWHVVGVARRPSPDAEESLSVDITRFDDVCCAFQTLPQLRLLVHAAATIGPVTSLPVSDPEEWRRAVEINLLGTYNVLRAALAGPLTHERGLVIHLTSGAASAAKPYWSAYSASKAGAEHLVRSAAADLEGTSCGVCSLDPGITETPMQQELRARDFPDRERFVRVYEERAGRTPEEVAAAICELSRREPRELNGRTFRVGAL